MEYKDYYKILGVSRTADDKTIKSAYRRLARRYHPDVNRGNADRFKEISEAYDVLSDPEKRRRYDTLGPDWQRHAEAGGGPRWQEVRFGTGDAGEFSEFFRTLFGDGGRSRRGGRRRVEREEAGPGGFRFGGISFEDLGDVGGPRPAARGEDLRAGIEVSLEEAFRGTTRTVSLQVEEPCPACSGAGHVSGTPCLRCGGSGWSRSTRRLEVKIPAGVDTGSQIRVSGEGAAGADGRRGDLYLLVTVTPHPQFERKGDDLHVDLPVPFVDAALGAEVQVPTLRGQVSMKIPPETSSGRVFRLPGYGMPRLKGGGAGDQYVRVQVTVPPGLTARERELLNQLRRARS